MNLSTESERPIYLQLVSLIMRDIVTGKYSPGEKLLSSREYAGIVSVNPNTVQKAYSVLEQTGLIQTNGTMARTVTQSLELIEKTKFKMAEKIITDFKKEMLELGYNENDTVIMFMKGCNSNE